MYKKVFMTRECVDISVFKNKTLIGFDQQEDYIIFNFENDENYLMFHDQDCCESVYIEEIHGDLSNLVGHEIVMAEAVTYRGAVEESFETYTSTFYKLGCVNGYVTIRWYGTSNGYYSEKVDIVKVGIRQSQDNLKN